MTTVSTNNQSDWKDMYDGFETADIGAGFISPNIYHSDEYAKKKQGKIIVGGIAETVYSAFDHDPTPLILTMAHEPAYNTILAYNLHYGPIQLRQAIIKLVLEQNRGRINSRKPIVVDYYSIKRQIPQSTGLVRRYKQVAMGVIGNIPLEDWNKVIRKPSQYQNLYRQNMVG